MGRTNGCGELTGSGPVRPAPHGGHASVDVAAGRRRRRWVQCVRRGCRERGARRRRAVEPSTLGAGAIRHPPHVRADPCRDGAGLQWPRRQASRQRGRALGRRRARRRETTARSPNHGRGDRRRTTRSLLMQQLTPTRATVVLGAASPTSTRTARDTPPRERLAENTLALRRAHGHHHQILGPWPRNGAAPTRARLGRHGNFREPSVVVYDAGDRVDLGPPVDPLQQPAITSGGRPRRGRPRGRSR